MTVTVSVLVFLAAARLVILLAIRLDRYEDELERRFYLREQGARGGEARVGRPSPESKERPQSDEAGRTRTAND